MERKTGRHRQRAMRPTLVLLILTAAIAAVHGAAMPSASLVMVTQASAGRLDYNRHTGLVAFDNVGSDGNFDVWTSEYSGRNRRCLTCALTPPGHKGQPAWTKDGEWVLFQKQNGDTACSPSTTIPGSGFCNDLWIVDRSGERARELYTVARNGIGALLHVAISDDDTRVLFSERVSDVPDRWALTVCTLQLGDSPSLSACKRYMPSASFWYESHQFLDGGTDKLLFTCLCDPSDRAFKDVDIATYTISTGKLTTLTAPDVWDEHAHQGPDGRIVWASSQDNAHPLLLDWWVMNADGTGKQRLTFYNMPGHPDYVPGGVVAADNLWVGPNRFLGLLMTDSVHQTGLLGTWQLPPAIEGGGARPPSPEGASVDVSTAFSPP